MIKKEVLEAYLEAGLVEKCGLCCEGKQDCGASCWSCQGRSHYPTKKGQTILKFVQDFMQVYAELNITTERNCCGEEYIEHDIEVHFEPSIYLSHIE